ncbi:hypothetical protein DL546_007794 [Coniochaeta pulveracea]|uniref:SRP9 domain-containing protein n=1 Tax=Coniochaeta pulveracea TaxID=177199 RepID=A0A420YJJ7_9PEZI|nr:hypothetical protein DL546_007794 [Coniochaeta pulveracea]
MLYEKSEDWLHQSSLLLEARPETTKITTTYTKTPARRPLSKSAIQKLSDANQPLPEPTALPPRATLELRTYCPVSGVALKYHTTKAAEVGRLISMLGGPLGRRMAGLNVEESGNGVKKEEDEEMIDAPAAESTPVQQTQQAGTGGGAAKGKKKKGKR